MGRAGGPELAIESTPPLVALTLAGVELGRDEPVAAHRLLDEVDRADVRPIPGEPALPAYAAVLRARALLADGDAAGARSLLTRLGAESTARYALPWVRLLEAELAPAVPRSGPGPTFPPPANPVTGTVTDPDQDTVTGTGTGTATRTESGTATGTDTDTATDTGPGTATGTDTDTGPGTAAGTGSVTGAGADLTGPCWPADAAAVLAGRALLAADDPAGALEAVRPLLDRPAGRLRPPDEISALLVAAAAHRRRGAAETAAGLLDRALARAEPDGAVRVFLDGGQPVRALLTLLVRPDDRLAPFAAKALARFDAQPSGRAGEEALRQAPPLTESELAVVRFLPSHMTNEEIAGAMFLSVNTVKTHLRAAYRKLGVSSRRAAIAQARRLDLL